VLLRRRHTRYCFHVSVRLGLMSAVFFLIAPGSLAGLVPYLLTRWQAHDWGAANTPARIAGAVLLAGGFVAIVECFRRFVTEGRGTPAPLRPPTTLVVHGLYRYVRNPMYVAVLAMTVGQALLLRRFILFGWAAAVWLNFHLFVVLYEEPKLRGTFGASYDAYRAGVRRWWPRVSPWTGRHDVQFTQEDRG
jgi:protein-S-isoprenylcysteine O-methyltransferase Ste14